MFRDAAMAALDAQPLEFAGYGGHWGALKETGSDMTCESMLIIQ